MIKNALIALLGMAVAAMLVFTKTPPLPDERSDVSATAGLRSAGARPEDSSASAQLKTGESPQHAGEIQTLQAKLASISEEHAVLQKKAREMETEISILNAARSNYLRVSDVRSSPAMVTSADLVGLLGNPDTLQLAMDWIKADLGPKYAPIFAQLGLDDAGRDALLVLLAERQATRLDVAHLGGGALRATDVTALETEFRTQLETLVGEEQAALFLRTEQKPLSWERLQRLDQRLRYEASPLDRAQFTDMWTMLSNQISYGPAPRTQEDVNRMIETRIASNAVLAREAAIRLTPEQTRALERHLADDVAASRIQLYSTVRVREALQNRPPPPR